jgi:DNA-binding MarR family transcriptional regulator
MKNYGPTDSAGYLTNLAARLFKQAIQRELRPIGVSPGQFPVIFALASGVALSQTALARIASTEQPSMAETLSKMQAEGLVDREPDPQDGRSVLYSLTPLAMDKADSILRAVKAVNALATAALTDAERSQFMAMLGKIIETLRASAAA